MYHVTICVYSHYDDFTTVYWNTNYICDSTLNVPHDKWVGYNAVYEGMIALFFATRNLKLVAFGDPMQDKCVHRRPLSVMLQMSQGNIRANKKVIPLGDRVIYLTNTNGVHGALWDCNSLKSERIRLTNCHPFPQQQMIKWEEIERAVEVSKDVTSPSLLHTQSQQQITSSQTNTDSSISIPSYHPLTKPAQQPESEQKGELPEPSETSQPKKKLLSPWKIFKNELPTD